MYTIGIINSTYTRVYEFSPQNITHRELIYISKEIQIC